MLLGSTVPIEGTVTTVHFDRQLPSPPAPDSQRCKNPSKPLNPSPAVKLFAQNPPPNGVKPGQESKGKSGHENNLSEANEPFEERHGTGDEQKQPDSAGSEPHVTAETMDQPDGFLQKQTIRMANAFTQSAFASQDKQIVGSNIRPCHFEGRDQKQPEPVPTADVADKGEPLSQQKMS